MSTLLPESEIPERWLDKLGGQQDASWGLAVFKADADAAVDALLWDRFYLGPLNLLERSHLLLDWLDVLENEDNFAYSLDTALTNWVDKYWHPHVEAPLSSIVSAWCCLADVVEGSANLGGRARLPQTADALLHRFPERRRFLGRMSTAPSSDPLGRYLAAIARYQRDRSLAPFWHSLCNLGESVPFYHAGYAIIGLRHLPASSDSETGTLSPEVVAGLIRLARSFHRLVREGRLSEDIAEKTFRRVAAQTAAAYPKAPNWKRYGVDEVRKLPQKPRQWLLKEIHPLAEAVNETPNPRAVRRTTSRAQPDRRWGQRAKKLAKQVEQGDLGCLQELERLLEEQRHYAESTGDAYFLVRSLCLFATRLRRRKPHLALDWAREAHRWEPANAYTWTAMKDALLQTGEVEQAVEVAWVAIERFPEDVVAWNGLAEVLKAQNRLEEAERVYRETIERFPREVDSRNHIIARNGWAHVLRRLGQWDKAEEVLQESINLKLNDNVTFSGEDAEMEPEIGAGAHSGEASWTVEGPSAGYGMAVAALVAEADFYRRWGKESPESERQARWAKASELLEHAENLASGDPDVAWARTALVADRGERENALEEIKNTLEACPNSASLLALQGRLKRELARGNPLDEVTLRDLTEAPCYLKELDGAFEPLFRLQSGLAALALSDGDVREREAAEALDKFAKRLKRRAKTEAADRKAARGKQDQKSLRFYEWLLPRVADLFLPGILDVGEEKLVQTNDIPSIESRLTENRTQVEEVEEIMVRRVVFSQF